MATEHILVVDDDPETLKLVGLVLRNQGYRVTLAATGQAALDAANADCPHLVLLDVMLPDMDGFAIARRLRANPDTLHVPIVMFTARGLVDDMAEGFEAGVNDYLTKPTHPVELLARVGSALSRPAGPLFGPPATGGRIVACFSATPGAGVTTLAVNMALALAGEAGRSVVLAELHPGPGVAASRLGITAPDRLADLALQVRDDYLPPDLAEQALSAPVHGVQLLAAPSVPLTDDQPGPDAAESIARALAGLAACVVIDLGSGQNRRIRAVARIAHRVVLVAEPLRPSMRRADQALHDLTGSGVEPPRVSVALAYRHPSLRHADPGVVSAGLGIDHVCVLPADPDRAAEALARGLPLLLLDPGGPPAQEMHRLGAEISRRLDLS